MDFGVSDWGNLGRRGLFRAYVEAEILFLHGKAKVSVSCRGFLGVSLRKIHVSGCTSPSAPRALSYTHAGEFEHKLHGVLFGDLGQPG